VRVRKGLERGGARSREMRTLERGGARSREACTLERSLLEGTFEWAALVDRGATAAWAVPRVCA
jgi:hypothetical protein